MSVSLPAQAKQHQFGGLATDDTAQPKDPVAKVEVRESLERDAKRRRQFVSEGEVPESSPVQATVERERVAPDFSPGDPSTRQPKAPGVGVPGAAIVWGIVALVVVVALGQLFSIEVSV